jgi:hypothetical protein
MTRPPQVRGETQQHFNGVPHTWCHWCTRWSADHSTQTHGNTQAQEPITAQVVGGATASPTPNAQAHFAEIFQSGTKYSMTGN